MGINKSENILKIDPYKDSHPVVYNPPQTPEERLRARDKQNQVRIERERAKRIMGR